MKESRFIVPKMDCPSEEQIIRRAVQPVEGIEGLHFDIEARLVTVQRRGTVDEVLARLEPLVFGARLDSTVEADDALPREDTAGEHRVLRQLLAINGIMFVAELGFGLWAESTGLIADSMDMLADAMVYGLSLYAVGLAATKQKQAARVSGWLQVLLAAAVLVEVARRFVVGGEPVETLMIGVAAVALVANLACVALLARHRKGGLHLRASWIFTTNDALANLGVIGAGLLVMATGSAIPDLVIGVLIGIVVLSGGLRILRL